MKLDSTPLLILGALGVAVYYSTQKKAQAPAVPPYAPQTANATALIAQTVTAAITAISKPVATTSGTTVPYAPMIDAPAYAPSGWAPPSF